MRISFVFGATNDAKLAFKRKSWQNAHATARLGDFSFFFGYLLWHRQQFFRSTRIARAKHQYVIKNKWTKVKTIEARKDQRSVSANASPNERENKISWSFLCIKALNHHYSFIFQPSFSILLLWLRRSNQSTRKTNQIVSVSFVCFDFDFDKNRIVRRWFAIK